MKTTTRRDFLRNLGLSTALLPFISNLPSVASTPAGRKQRLLVVFSPNGIVPNQFWPDAPGEHTTFKRILAPLEPFRDRTLILQGIANKVRGDGDSHMRGMSCLLTGIELFPGNIQGGSDTPAGWASGISIDQELKNFFQSRPETRTRFGSLELGVAVPKRADVWTRMCYAGPNKPVAPQDDPYQVFATIYGEMKEKEAVTSILDDLQDDLRKLAAKVSSEDRQMLNEHAALVRQMEKDLQGNAKQAALAHPAPKLEAGILPDNDTIPQVSRMQIDLLVNAFANDFTRVATLQYTNSVGNAKMKWLGIEEGHHTLSHDPDLNEVSQEKLTKINVWFCQELAHLLTRLASTREPGGEGSLLDNTLVIWTNELGKGNSHTLDNIPFVLVGGGCGFKMGRALKFERAAHNCLWVSIAQRMGHQIETFGNPKLCEGGPLDLA
ncbi:MAG TPA: DUF1552 domain-containing protein [Methylomirabilota bacterium]|nr:DUF1552 domain-containing protein [Methylomirabilota bacterium]